MFDPSKARMDTPYVAVHLGTVGSTQREARQRFDGTPLLVTAGAQTSGRGRSGKEWVTADRALAASLAFEAVISPLVAGPLPLIAGLAARAALGGPVGLKWPNDLVVGDDKIGGILTQALEDLVVVGLGVNLWWPHPIDGAAGLYGVDPGPEEGRRVGESWAADLMARLPGLGDDWGMDEYAARCVTIGRAITWSPHGAGLATAIAADGGLIVETASGGVVLRSGEVHQVRVE